jgi:hypothetical protein
METTNWVILVIGIACVIAGFVLVFFGTRSRKKLMVIKETPTVTAAEAAQMADAVGKPRVEIKGTAVSEKPLISPASNTPCLYYKYKVERRIERETRDAEGNWDTEYHWETLESGEESVPFVLRDASGDIWVAPQGAHFVADKKVDREDIGPGFGSRSTGSVMGDLADGFLDSLSGHREYAAGIRVQEYVVALDQPTYVLGIASRSADGTVSLGKGEGPFIISFKSEEELTKKFGRNYILQYVFGAILAVGGVAAAIVGVAI